jgi:tellurite resistance protein TehA-like permease
MQSNEALLVWLGIASLAVFVATLVVLPVLLIRLPADHFLPGRRRALPWGMRHPVLRWSYRVAGNLVGGVLILAGAIMLVLPGQGLLTMLAGLMLTDFPGKYRVERWIVGKPAIRGAIDALRRRAGRPPLVLQEGDPETRTSTGDKA